MGIKNTLTITDVSRNMADYINRVAYRGESFTLMRGKKAVAELKPVSLGRKLAELPGLLNSLPHLSPDEADDLAQDLDEFRQQLAKEPTDNPWES